MLTGGVAVSDYDLSEEEPETEESHLQIDAYGIKAKPVLGEAEPPPKSWREVWERVHQSLMSIATEPFCLVADTLSSARVLIKGVATLPRSLGQRVAGAHSKIEEREGAAEENADLPKLQQSQALENVEAAIAKFQAQGLAVGLKKLENGQLIISICTPDEQQAAQEIAQSAIENTSETPLLEAEEARDKAK